MRTRIYLFIYLLVILLSQINVYAQYDERGSGIYAIVGEEYKPLKLLDGLYYAIEEGHATFYYNGETTGVIASDTFLLVVGHDKLVYFNDPFLETLTPDALIILPLTVNTEKQCMQCEPGEVSYLFEDGLVRASAGLEFEWEKIKENSFRIKVHGLKPGEYEISVPDQGDVRFKYRHSYGFTIAEILPQK